MQKMKTKVMRCQAPDIVRLDGYEKILGMRTRTATVRALMDAHQSQYQLETRMRQMSIEAEKMDERYSEMSSRLDVIDRKIESLHRGMLSSTARSEI